MQYMGGKTRIAKQIAAEIDKVRQPGQLVWDAFCGGLSVSRALYDKGPVWSTDANPALISLYQALQRGWEPPTEVSKEEWISAKNLPDSDPLKAFCGFALSFGGKWFSSYSKPRPKYAKPVAGAAKKAKLDGLLGPYECVDFLSVTPHETDMLIYCDPPYAGTGGYSAVASFDYCKFVQRLEQWSEFTDIFVSEYDFRLGVCVWEQKSLVSIDSGLSGKAKTVTERLFHIKKNSIFI